MVMLTQIRKRDGRLAPYDKKKISNAIFKAAKSVGGSDGELADSLADEVETRLLENFDAENIPMIEEIQDEVERVLMNAGHDKTAKAFIIYRNDRSRVRERKTPLIQMFAELSAKSAKESDIKRENANINGDTAMGTMLKFGSIGSKHFYDLNVLKPEHSAAHNNGDIHIHDLDFLTLTTTCCQIDIIKLFKNGFSTGHGFIREPNNIASYSALACIAFQSNQNDQHGGQSIPNFDYAMAQGVRKSYKQLYLKNIVRAICLFNEIEDANEIIELENKVKAYTAKIEEELGICPVLANDNGFKEAERKYLNEFFENNCNGDKDGETKKVSVSKIQKFAINLTAQETDRATFQAMEALVHNLNTMNSRAGAQTPFSSINYGTDTSPEGRMVIKNILLANEKGLGNSETPIFPIHIFKVKDGVNYSPSDANYDLFKLACRVSAKRLFPNFSFLDAPFNLQFYKEGDYDTEVAYMGCRTRVVANKYDESRNVTCGRGNLSFTSINLPRLGMKSKGDINKFFALLEKQMNLAIDQLKFRYNIQAKKTVRNFPFLMGQGVWLDSEKLNPDDEIGEVLKHGTLSLGYIGLAECLIALIGSHHGESEEAQELGLRIIGRMRERLDEECDKTKMNFSLIATPAEGLSGTFVNKDKPKYGIREGITDHGYYTNSFHVPVNYNITAYDKIKIEAPYHALSNAGHISYVEMDGDPCNNLEAFEKVIRLMKESGIGYGAINHPVDHDPVCGYTGVIGDACPACGRTEADGKPKFERIRRITGYLVGTLDRFNDAKQAEEKERIKHGT